MSWTAVDERELGALSARCCLASRYWGTQQPTGRVKCQTTSTANHMAFILHPTPTSFGTTCTQVVARHEAVAWQSPSSGHFLYSILNGNSLWTDHRKPLQNRFDSVRRKLSTSASCATPSHAA